MSPRLGHFDYGSRAAAMYDETRSASPSVLGPLRAFLRDAPGRRLADIGGGTGNYAAALHDLEGFEPLVVDVSAEMLRRAEAKGLATLQSDAAALQLGDGRFHAVTMISMLHHVPDWRAALGEARRILRPGGRLAVKGFGREHAEVFWPLRYFPSGREWFDRTHASIAEALQELPGAAVATIEFEDLQDASLAALSHSPGAVLQAGREGRTSFFARLRTDAPEELAQGLDALKRDLAAGRHPELAPEVLETRARLGDAVLICWTKPAQSSSRS